MLRNKIKYFFAQMFLVVTGPYWILGMHHRMKRDFGIGLGEAMMLGWFDDSKQHEQWWNENWRSLWVREE